MASAKRGSKKSSAKKAPATKTVAKKATPAKRATLKKSGSKKQGPLRFFGKAKRNAAIAAAAAIVAAGAAVVVRVVRRRMGLASTTPTATAAAACTIVNRGDVSRIVITYIRGLGFPNATEGSNFTSAIPTTPKARRVWAGDLVAIVQQRGCSVGSDFGPDQCAEAKKVRDIVDALWASVQKANGIEEA